MDIISQFLQNNPYFNAGAGLFGMGLALSLIRNASMRLATMMQRKFSTSLEINSKDIAFPWLSRWLSRRSLLSGNHLTVISAAVRGKDMAPIAFTAGNGIHYLRWNGQIIKVHREREKSALLDLSTGRPFESIKMSCIGTKTDTFSSLLTEAYNEVVLEQEGKLVIYTSFAADWRPFGNARRKRDIGSIILDKGVKERLVDDVNEFLSASKWYSKRGIPYRRGYLLHGPPGGGKSSFVQALASSLDYNVCLLNLSETALSDDRLNHLFNAIPDRSILLLEDVDGISSKESNKKLSMSGLLNALDGVAASEERIIFMTTNHFDALDPALIRPGRVDLLEYVGYATEYQAKKMFSLFYPNEPSKAAEEFAKLNSANNNISPAQIQGHFIKYKDQPSKMPLEVSSKTTEKIN